MALVDKREKFYCEELVFSVLSLQADQPQPSIPQSYSTPVQFGNSLPKTPSLPEQKKLPNPVPANSTSDENEGDNKKQSHTQLDSRKQVTAFQDRVITINIKEAQHPLK